MLRGKPPEAVKKRLKMFMFGEAGFGKTTAAIQFPKPYIIDCERGTEHYDARIRDVGGAVFQTTNMDEVVAEVKALAMSRHDYRTLVIDPITPVYNDLLDKGEDAVGSDHGRHYQFAGKQMKRMANLINNLDMNVIITAHAKKEYGQNMSVLGVTFDGWKALDYWFDLTVQLQKRGKKRVGLVKKTRLDGFPDEDVFEWSYDEIRRRYGADQLEREAKAVAFATPQQVAEMRGLLVSVRLPAGTVDKWLAKAGADRLEDMPGDALAKCIDYVKGRATADNGAAATV